MLTSKITTFDRPNSFSDEMVDGAFKQFKHSHIFKSSSEGTVMTDIFDYTSPLGLVGKIADVLFLKRYMIKLLEKRNHIVKHYAETQKWNQVLK